jgi:hypothetical protein
MTGRPDSETASLFPEHWKLGCLRQGDRDHRSARLAAVGKMGLFADTAPSAGQLPE